MILPIAMFAVMASFLTLLLADPPTADNIAIFYGVLGVGLTGFNLWREWRHGRHHRT